MTPEEKAVRQRLADRRERLAAAAAGSESEGRVELLRRVDSALTRMDGGKWAICVDCKVPVEPELLELSPAVQVCFDCLSPEDLRALERDLEGAARVQRALLPGRRRHPAGDPEVGMRSARERGIQDSGGGKSIS